MRYLVIFKGGDIFFENFFNNIYCVFCNRFNLYIGILVARYFLLVVFFRVVYILKFYIK